MARKGLDQYVEPYGGGAGAAIDLLLSGAATQVVINDLDPAIHAFWIELVERPEELIRKTRSAEFSIAEWRHQRAIYKAGRASDRGDLAFATLYVNRTSRSGVMNAGIIGGLAQDGAYKMDARFEPRSIADRIEAIARKREQITVSNEDGVCCIARYLRGSNTLIYADPPYFDKGSFLYLNSFDAQDHARLAQTLNGAPDRNWVVTYDNVQIIHELYRERKRVMFDLDYSAHRRESAREVLIASDALSSSIG